MTEIDLENIEIDRYNHLDVNFKIIKKELSNYCNRYKSDIKMLYCRELIDEIYHNLSEHFRNPTSIEIFSSKEEFDKRQEEIDPDKFAISNWDYESHQIIIVDAHEKDNHQFKSFRSKEEAETWIREKEKEEKEKEEKYNSLLSLPDEMITQWIPYEYEIKEYKKEYWVIECFKIGSLKRKLYFLYRAWFDEWFLELIQKNDYGKFYYSIDVVGSGQIDDTNYLLELYSVERDWIIDILGDVGFGDEVPLFFLLQFNFTPIVYTNEFLDYHLVNTFKSDKLKFKTYLKDALLAWEDKMTLAPKHLTKLHDYINDNLQISVQDLQVKEVIANEKTEIIETELDDEIDDNLFEDIEEGMGDLENGQIENFIYLFHSQKNKKRKPYLGLKEVKILQKIRLRLPVNESDCKYRFTLDMDEGEKNFFYQLFLAVWLKNRESDRSGSKIRYARYLRTYFTNFPPTDKPILDSMRKNHRWDKIEKIVEESLFGKKNI